MEASPEIVTLLTEIRDNQRIQMEKYEANMQRSLAVQDEAVERQRLAIKIYVRALIVGGVIVGGLVVLIIYMLGLF